MHKHWFRLVWLSFMVCGLLLGRATDVCAHAFTLQWRSMLQRPLGFTPHDHSIGTAKLFIGLPRNFYACGEYLGAFRPERVPAGKWKNELDLYVGWSPTWGIWFFDGGAEYLNNTPIAQTVGDVYGLYAEAGVEATVAEHHIFRTSVFGEGYSPARKQSWQYDGNVHARGSYTAHFGRVFLGIGFEGIYDHGDGWIVRYLPTVKFDCGKGSFIWVLSAYTRATGTLAHERPSRQVWSAGFTVKF